MKMAREKNCRAGHHQVGKNADIEEGCGSEMKANDKKVGIFSAFGPKEKKANTEVEGGAKIGKNGGQPALAEDRAKERKIRLLAQPDAQGLG